MIDAFHLKKTLNNKKFFLVHLEQFHFMKEYSISREKSSRMRLGSAAKPEDPAFRSETMRLIQEETAAKAAGFVFCSRFRLFALFGTAKISFFGNSLQKRSFKHS